MDDILASVAFGNSSSIHIATLSKKTIEEAGASHMGYSGYFLFEETHSPESNGINILCKVLSLDAGFRLIDLWNGRGADLPTQT